MNAGVGHFTNRCIPTILIENERHNLTLSTVLFIIN